SIAAVAIVCFGVDIFRQTRMQQVSSTTAVFSLQAGGRLRLNLNAVMMISVMGTSVGNKVVIEHEWRAAALLSLAWCG
ncbi:hypothetical protein BXZ70DRAFT_902462, partial [Cristinia sonorae]